MSEQKQYILFLENYNSSLKKEVVLWMGKPQHDNINFNGSQGRGYGHLDFR